MIVIKFVILKNYIAGEGLTTYLIAVRTILVLGAIGSIAKRFAAARIFTCVRFLTSVGPQMCLEILQTRVGLTTSFEL